MGGGGGGLAVSCDECGACNFDKRARVVVPSPKHSLLAPSTKLPASSLRPETCGEVVRGYQVGDGDGGGIECQLEISRLLTTTSLQFTSPTAIMVAGKNTTNQLARAASAPKLPPLPKLRVRKPDQTNANPCLGVMTTMLGMSSYSSQKELQFAFMQYCNSPGGRHDTDSVQQAAGHPQDTQRKAAPL
jgi:hypothetical protein